MSAEIRKNPGHVFRKEKSRLLAFIRKRVDKVEDAEDILQDVFYHTLCGYSVTEPIENLAGWLYVSARNRITDWYRTKSRRIARSEALDSDATLRTVMLESGLNPETQYIREQIRDAIAEAIDALPDYQREVVILQMIEGRTFQEISDLSGQPVATLISRKQYALQKLRKSLRYLKDEIE